jgi:2-polyprenyl-3-methyl-5-hydroxy-6-metoxy-1,4-benzoquinol methylase
MAHEQENSKASARESAAKGTHGAVLRALQEHVSGGWVLDVPCGSGAFLRRLETANYRAVGADIAPHAALHGHVAVVCDMTRPLPLASASLDAVVSIDGIEHIRRPFDFVAECRRVLRPGGVLVLSTPNISSARSRWRHLMTGFHNKGKSPLDEEYPAPRHHINLLSFPTLRYMLHTQGFHIEGVTANRAKPAAWLYAPWWPVQRLAMHRAFTREAKDERHRRISTDVARQMASKAVFFGETLVLVARAV